MAEAAKAMSQDAALVRALWAVVLALFTLAGSIVLATCTSVYMWWKEE